MRKKLYTERTKMIARRALNVGGIVTFTATKNTLYGGLRLKETDGKKPKVYMMVGDNIEHTMTATVLPESQGISPFEVVLVAVYPGRQVVMIDKE